MSIAYQNTMISDLSAGDNDTSDRGKVTTMPRHFVDVLRIMNQRFKNAKPDFSKKAAKKRSAGKSGVSPDNRMPAGIQPTWMPDEKSESCILNTTGISFSTIKNAYVCFDEVIDPLRSDLKNAQLMSDIHTHEKRRQDLERTIIQTNRILCNTTISESKQNELNITITLCNREIARLTDLIERQNMLVKSRISPSVVNCKTDTLEYYLQSNERIKTLRSWFGQVLSMFYGWNKIGQVECLCNMYIEAYMPDKHSQIIANQYRIECAKREEKEVYTSLTAFGNNHLKEDYARWVAARQASQPFKCQDIKREYDFNHWYVDFPSLHTFECKHGNDIYYKVNDIFKQMTEKIASSLPRSKIDSAPVKRELGPREIAVRSMEGPLNMKRRTTFLRYSALRDNGFFVVPNYEFQELYDLKIHKAFGVEFNCTDVAVKLLISSKIINWDEMTMNEFKQYYLKKGPNMKERELLFGKIGANQIAKEIAYQHVTMQPLSMLQGEYEEVRKPTGTQVPDSIRAAIKLSDKEKELIVPDVHKEKDLEIIGSRVKISVEGVVNPTSVGVFRKTCLIPESMWMSTTRSSIVRKFRHSEHDYLDFCDVYGDGEDLDYQEHCQWQRNLDQWALDWWNSLPQNRSICTRHFLRKHIREQRQFDTDGYYEDDGCEHDD